MAWPFAPVCLYYVKVKVFFLFVPYFSFTAFNCRQRCLAWARIATPDHPRFGPYIAECLSISPFDSVVKLVRSSNVAGTSPLLRICVSIHGIFCLCCGLFQLIAARISLAKHYFNLDGFQVEYYHIAFLEVLRLTNLHLCAQMH